MRHVIVQMYDRYPGAEPPESEPKYEFHTVAKLSAEAAVELRLAHLYLKEFLNGEPFGLVRMNRAMHKTFVDDLRSRFTSGGFLPGDTEMHRFAIASLMNFTSAIHAYQEHSEIRAGRVGHQKLRGHVHQCFREAYGASPALYLMRRIRGVMVHSQLDVVSVISGTRAGGLSQAERYVDVCLNVDKLQTQDLNQTLKAHLNEHGPQFSVLDGMDRALNSLRTLNNQIMPLLYPDLRACALVVCEADDLLRQTVGDDHGCCLTALPDTASQFLKSKWEQFLLVGETVDLARDILSKTEEGPAPA